MPFLLSGVSEKGRLPFWLAARLQKLGEIRIPHGVFWGWGTLIILGLSSSILLIWATVQVDAHWISPLANKPLSWDFTNLWFGGKLALAGDFRTIFDVDAYRAALRAEFAPYIDDSEWSYPPSILLLGIPLAILPLPVAWAIWSLGGVLTLVAAGRAFGLAHRHILLICLSPAFVCCLVLGQNGAYVAALLLGGLWMAPKRPGWAGFMFALLTFKAQFGLLVPICLLAARNWRAIAFAVAYGLIIAAVTALLFGPSIWLDFNAVTRPLMVSILEAPFPQPYQMSAVTAFIAGRGLGGSVDAAYAVQGVVALACCVTAYRLWSTPACDPKLRLAATAALTILATPYGYTYDMVMVSFGVALAVHQLGWRKTTPLAFIWLWPSFSGTFTFFVGPYAVVILLAAAIILTRFAFQSAAGSLTLRFPARD